jgi:8-oxo-dGTP pyrophosphatase MutT (NUDIX family)
VVGRFGGYNWSFVKGRREAGETAEAAALREVFEEMGVHAKIVSHLIDAKGDITKTRFFIGRIENEVDLNFSSAETEKLTWATVAEARTLLNKPRDNAVLDAYLAKWEESLFLIVK